MAIVKGVELSEGCSYITSVHCVLLCNGLVVDTECYSCVVLCSMTG